METGGWHGWWGGGTVGLRLADEVLQLTRGAGLSHFALNLEAPETVLAGLQVLREETASLA